MSEEEASNLIKEALRVSSVFSNHVEQTCKGSVKVRCLCKCLFEWGS